MHIGEIICEIGATSPGEEPEASSNGDRLILGPAELDRLVERIAELVIAKIRLEHES